MEYRVTLSTDVGDQPALFKDVAYLYSAVSGGSYSFSITGADNAVDDITGLKEDATVAVAPQANHSGSTSAVDVMEKALTEAQDTPIAAGRYAVKFSCKPEPLPQPEVAAGEDKPPPHVNVLPPPLALTEFKKEEPDLPLGAYAAHYQLKFEVRLPPAPGSQEPLRASSEPLKLTVFE